MKQMSPYGLNRSGTFTATFTANLRANGILGRCSLAGCQMKIDVSFKTINHSLALQSRLRNRPFVAKWAVELLIGTYWNDYADGGRSLNNQR